MSEPKPAPPRDEQEPGLAVKLGMMLLSCLLTAGLSEGLLRLADDDTLPQLSIFQASDWGGVELQPLASARVRRKGWVFEVRTDSHGLRVSAPAPSAPGGWLVVGDSQVLGQGVAAADTFPALMTAAGVPAANGGVPGYGVADALAHAEALLDSLDPAGVLVVLNQSNDWEDAAAPVGERFRVRGGWLVSPDEADGPRGRFLASPLARIHLVFYAGWYLLRSPDEAPAVPGWMAVPEAEHRLTESLSRLVDGFAARHGDRVVAEAFLPVDIAVSQVRLDTSPFAELARSVSRKPWDNTALRDQVLSSATVPVVDLLPALSGCADCFLARDYHLSARGHAAAASALIDGLPELAR